MEQLVVFSVRSSDGVAVVATDAAVNEGLVGGVFFVLVNLHKFYIRVPFALLELCGHLWCCLCFWRFLGLACSYLPLFK